MSKTDNTRPYWVQVQDSTLPARAWHNCGGRLRCDYDPRATFATADEYLDHRCARLPHHTGGELPTSKVEPREYKRCTRQHRQQVRTLLRLAEQLGGDYDLVAPPHPTRGCHKFGTM